MRYGFLFGLSLILSTFDEIAALFCPIGMSSPSYNKSSSFFEWSFNGDESFLLVSFLDLEPFFNIDV